MIDFSTLKGLTIPEGNVKQISDAQGNALWSAGKPCTVKFIGQGTPTSGIYPSTPYAMMDGTKYTPDGTTKEVIVPSGTTIDFNGLANMMGGIRLTINGATIIEYGKQSMGKEQTLNYTYSVQGNVEIIIKNDAFNSGWSTITITEIRNDPATITTSSAGYSSNYVDYAYIEFVDVKGNTYKVDSQGGAIDIEASMAAGAPVWTNTFEIPAGTAITCFVQTGTQYTPGYVKVNGTKVLNKTSGSGTYAYVVTGDASVKLYTYGNSSSNAYGYIEITET